jgi:DNA-binding XRE family transcriptional regulator
MFQEYHGIAISLCDRSIVNVGWSLPKLSGEHRAEVASIAAALTQMRSRSRRTQTEVATAMGTTQTAIARLESGRQSPTLQTLRNYARANGYCLEIGFIGAPAGQTKDRTGFVMVVDDTAPAIAPKDKTGA